MKQKMIMLSRCDFTNRVYSIDLKAKKDSILQWVMVSYKAIVRTEIDTKITTKDISVYVDKKDNDIVLTIVYNPKYTIIRDNATLENLNLISELPQTTLSLLPIMAKIEKDYF